MNSILISIKKMLSIEAEYTHFDADIILHINAVLMGLTQIGVGPINGFFVLDELSTWTDFIGDRKDIEGVKTYIALKVRLLFDPPSSSFVLDAMERQVRELEWRINSQVDKLIPEEVTVDDE